MLRVIRSHAFLVKKHQFIVLLVMFGFFRIIRDPFKYYVEAPSCLKRSIKIGSLQSRMCELSLCVVFFPFHAYALRHSCRSLDPPLF